MQANLQGTLHCVMCLALNLLSGSFVYKCVSGYAHVSLLYSANTLTPVSASSNGSRSRRNHVAGGDLLRLWEVFP